MKFGLLNVPTALTGSSEWPARSAIDAAETGATYGTTAMRAAVTAPATAIARIGNGDRSRSSQMAATIVPKPARSWRYR